ncbi:MAG: penicillin acylase family protein [Microthrixaceae bacterium]
MSRHPRATTTTRRGLRAAVCVAATMLVAAACTDGGSDGEERADEPDMTVPADAADRSWYILPPGNYGGLPTTDNSLDQLPLYDGLTLLRGDVDDADIEELFLPQDFEPVGETTEEDTGRPGVEILYDSYGVPHITGETREDLAFGAGWVTARDRELLLDFGLDATRAAASDIPGVDAFDLVLEGVPFEPSEQAEALLEEQIDLLVEVAGEEGEEIVADASAYADGANAYFAAQGTERDPVTARDVIATTAFIGSIFGQGGGSEASNAELLAALQEGLGDGPGREVWEDVMLIGDPEAPTTLEEEFDYGVMTGGEVTGSVEIDAGSVTSVDVLAEATAAEPPAAEAAAADAAPEPATPAMYEAAGPPPARQASNWLLVDPAASENSTPMGVLGPQLGYFYPEIVQQVHLSGPGIEAQGASVVGLGIYLLLGRTEDYAWSLTSASHDVRDVFAEVLCEPDGSEPTVESSHYEFDGECIPLEVFDAGLLDGTPVSFERSVHGPVIGTATSEGRPIALSRARSTFGRDALNLVALKRMTEGRADTIEDFYDTANEFGFTFNWGYVGREGVAYFSSGRLPIRAEGLDRRLPTLGTGEYEWQGFLERDEHPHGRPADTGRLVNWNNQSAPGFMHGDGTSYGSVHRVEMFDQWPERVDLAGVVGVMNRSATEDPNSLIWPSVSSVLAAGEPPSELAGQVAEYLDTWVAEDAPAVDEDDDGFYDQGGPAVIDAAFEPLVLAVLEPVLGDQASSVYEERDLDGDSGSSIVDKDLRTLLGEDVDGPFNRRYCGDGSLEQCAQDLWAVVDTVATELAAQYESEDPGTWLMEGRRTTFRPGLIEDTMRATNRPTFQQLIELVP